MADAQTQAKVFGTGLSATALAAVVTDRFTTVWLNWEPQVLVAEVASVFQVPLQEKEADRLHAVALLNTTDAFSASVEAFLTVCRALTGLNVKEGYFMPVDLTTLLKGCAEAALHVGQLTRMHPDIARLVGIILEQYGMFYPPEILEFAEYSKSFEQRVAALRGDTSVADSVFWDDQETLKRDMNVLVRERIHRILGELQTVPADINPEATKLIAQTLETPE